MSAKSEEMSLLSGLTKKFPETDSGPSAEPEEHSDERKLECLKSKKSFCIDALLARNENKMNEFNLRDIRCNNELARLFRQKTDGKMLFEEDSPKRKLFPEKSRLFESFEVEKRSVESQNDGECDINDESNKAELFHERDSYFNEEGIRRCSPEYESRDYENSGSATPFSVKTNETRSNSPGQSELSSPPISPGNENDYESGKTPPNGEDVRGSQIFPRPGLLVSNNPQTFINQNPNLMLGSRPNLPHIGPHPAFLAYSNPHSFSSAFHPLNTNAPANAKLPNGSNAGLKQGVNVSPNSGGSILGLNAGSQHLHHMQLEWLARTGMFYPRLPELAATK